MSRILITSSSPLSLLLGSFVFVVVAGSSSEPIYTDQFVVNVDGGPDVARDLASKHGFQYLGQDASV
ncbi:hypothetical protein IscW_ISCW021103 [Ixodes scapularis]|uniref:Peptidase S8 pro-domain domain-containing protein n=1 Tax=Ixodes scapularis TaxID=6945 RepID=B7Q3X3_IXOSC|nr:hypothetical protein IscW_ISCW021103 [Ixodes scapularis]|eukprot:XP_002399683.1 hypothetical protein IscW_ISCW021103 [Ixodes scapularis]